MVVEPDDAGDAAGAVVDEEFKEVGFPLPADDNADGLSAGDEAAVKVEGEGVGVGDLGEGEEVRCQELDVCGGKGVHGSAYCSTSTSTSTVGTWEWKRREIQFKLKSPNPPVSCNRS